MYYVEGKGPIVYNETGKNDICGKYIANWKDNIFFYGWDDMVRRFEHREAQAIFCSINVFLSFFALIFRSNWRNSVLFNAADNGEIRGPPADDP